MIIYDKDNNWTIGFNLNTRNLKEIMKVFRKSINLGKTKNEF